MSVPVKNEPVVIMRPAAAIDEDNYWCRRCGAMNSGRASYSEVAYGHGHIMDSDLTLDYTEIDDYDEFEINLISCEECRADESTFSVLFTTDESEVEREDETY